MDFDHRVGEGVAAEANVGGQAPGLELELGGDGATDGPDDGVDVVLEPRGKLRGNHQAAAPGVELGFNGFKAVDLEHGDGHAIGHAEGQHGVTAVGRQLAGREGDEAVGKVECEQKVAEEGEAQDAVAIAGFGEEGVIEGADIGEGEAGKLKRIDEHDGRGLAADAAGVGERSLAYGGQAKLRGQGGRDHGVAAGAGVDHKAEGALAVDHDLDVGLAVIQIHADGVGFVVVGGCGDYWTLRERSCGRENEQSKDALITARDGHGTLLDARFGRLEHGSKKLPPDRC